MRTKMFNLFSLIANAIASVTCIASISMMAAYAHLEIFSVASFYLTIAAFVISFIGMQYNVRTFNSDKPITPKWYIVLRLMVISSLIMNSGLSFAFTEKGAWSMPYFLTRLALPLLLGLCFILFDVDTKVPFTSILVAPSFFALYYAIALPVFGLADVTVPYEIFDVKNNPWTVTLLLVIGTFACLILIAALLRALNFSIHYAAYGKIENEELRKQIEEANEAKKVEELEKEAEFNAKIEEEIEKEVNEVILESNKKDEGAIETPTQPIIDRSTKTIKKIHTDTISQANVNTDTKTIKKVESPTTVIEKVNTDTKTIKKLNTNTGRIKKVDTSTKTQKKIDTNTGRIKKFDTSTKQIAKVDTLTKTIKKVDTSTKTINKINENEARVYHVLRHETLAKWQVKFEGASRALKLFKTQVEAINYARDLVKNKGGSILIHSTNGTIRKG